ncbi:MAG: hypothetical protein MHMPM18_000122 [Marteilia pararefringens]
MSSSAEPSSNDFTNFTMNTSIKIMRSIPNFIRYFLLGIFLCQNLTSGKEASIPRFSIIMILLASELIMNTAETLHPESFSTRNSLYCNVIFYFTVKIAPSILSTILLNIKLSLKSSALHLAGVIGTNIISLMLLCYAKTLRECFPDRRRQDEEDRFLFIRYEILPFSIIYKPTVMGYTIMRFTAMADSPDFVTHDRDIFIAYFVLFVLNLIADFIFILSFLNNFDKYHRIKCSFVALVVYYHVLLALNVIEIVYIDQMQDSSFKPLHVKIVIHLLMALINILTVCLIVKFDMLCSKSIENYTFDHGNDDDTDIELNDCQESSNSDRSCTNADIPSIQNTNSDE